MCAMPVARGDPHRPPRRRVSGRLSLALLAAGYAALIAAWLVANPFGRAPDEPAHYVRALAAGTGDVHGQRVSLPGYSPATRKWVEGIGREFSLPPRLVLAPNPCPVFDPKVPASCQRSWPATGPPGPVFSNVGSYQPYIYAPVGALMNLAPTPWAAFLIGRAVMATVSLALIALAALTLWQPHSRGGLPLHPALVLGLVAAVSPMEIFLAGSLNPSGVEIAAGLATAAGLLSLAARHAPRGAWLTFGAGATVLALTRSLGPYFVAVLVGIGVLAFGGRLLQAAREAPEAAVVAAGCVVGAAVLNLWWEAAYQPHLSWAGVFGHLTLSQVPELSQEVVGKFGWLEAHLPWPFYVAWGVVFATLVVFALARGTWIERAALFGLLAGCAALAVAFHSVMPETIGFDFQGRYLMPLVVAAPLLAGEILRRRRISLRSLSIWAATAGLVAAVLQFLGWYLNARRYAVGTSGPEWFVSRAAWVPPGGWILWIAVAVAGSLCIATGSVLVAAPRLAFGGAVEGRARTPSPRADTAIAA